ncbi:hypothetical protein BDV98DRAFT_381940 [Pterulicium gracile]|uniref:RRM domain-containing protein n=1 Tax=Pterulicium gracile TaxID=1884261 RepID=A0A5C3QMZ2_9AGAR|nr:hypothetical protein BDV98DRAFT_381940 [Pterula gracilis]
MMCVQYETNSDDVYRRFSAHGDIKTFFDLISNRGMVFVTYYDLRHAERARDHLQGSEISGRPIDVHYSLPRDDHAKGIDRERNQAMQGTIQITLRDSRSGMPIDEGELRRKFTPFGDIKAINSAGGPEFLEYFDMRSCDVAFDKMRYTSFQDGTLEIQFSWDEPPAPANTRAGPYDKEKHDDKPRGGAGRGRGRSGRGGRGRGGYDDDDDRRDYGRGGGGRDQGGPGPRGGGGRFEDEFGREARDGPGEPEQNNSRFDSGPSDRYPGGPPPPAAGYYGAPQGGYGGPPPPPAAGPPPPENDRLEQARKVQQLLAALKQPAQPPQPPTPTYPTMPPPGASSYYPPGYPGPPPPAAAPYGSTAAPPSGYGSAPPPPGYGAPPPGYGPGPRSPPPSAMGYAPPAAAPAPPSLGGVSLPPNITALLQQMGSAPPPGAGYAAAPGPSSEASGGGQQGLQQLMSFLQSQQNKQA